MRPLVLAAVAAVAVVAAGCTGGAPTVRNRRGETVGRAFEFQGGAEGEWNVRFRGDSFWCAFDMNGKVVDYGSVKLEEDEASRLWDLIDSARLDRRRSSTRKATDEDEPLYMFWAAPREAGLRDDPPKYVEIWADDVYEDKRLTRLLRYLTRIIGKYHKKKAIL